MTIREQEHTGDGAEVGLVLCQTPHGGRDGTTHLIAPIHKGYGDQATPLNKEDLAIMAKAAQKHDLETRGKHDIVIFQFHK